MSQRTDLAYPDSRRVSMRASLHQALVEDEEPKLWARPDDADANERALARLKGIAQLGETPSVDIGANWDHGNARYWMWSTEAGAEAFVYTEEQLWIAATFVAAEFQFSTVWRGDGRALFVKSFNRCRRPDHWKVAGPSAPGFLASWLQQLKSIVLKWIGILRPIRDDAGAREPLQIDTVKHFATCVAFSLAHICFRGS